MKRIPVAILMLTGCATESRETPDLTRVTRALSEAACAADPENPLHRIEVSPITGEDQLYVAVRDWITNWSGDFICFKYSGGQIEWTATLSEEPVEQSILEVRGFHLRGFPNPLVEVFGITHMGNGNLYLYELCGRELRLLLLTRAIDQHAGLNLIRGPHLTVEYRDLDGDGYPDVELTGIVEEYSDDPHLEAPIRSYPCRKVFLWNPSIHRFLEDRSQSQGFRSYPDDDR